MITSPTHESGEFFFVDGDLLKFDREKNAY